MQRVGDGRDVHFLDGSWLGDKTLKELFTRLFHLSTRKEGMVKQMGDWVDGKWVWRLVWRRNLFDREKAKENEL